MTRDGQRTQDAVQLYATGGFTRMLHKSLVRELARPFNVELFEYIGACVFASHG